MRYLPHTNPEIEEMCQTIGVKQLRDLFDTIPEELRLKGFLDLPAPLAEQDLIAHLKKLSRSNETVDHYSSFLGGGAYHHYVPVAVGHLISRGEFATSYTPYQAELSQGTLQAIFEFQTMIASLFGLDLSNASMYDGATALAEAVLMALRLKKKKEVLLARSIHPEYRQVVKTTLQNLGYTVKEVGWSPSGQVNAQELKSLFSSETSAFCVQSPNFFGGVEDLKSLGEITHQADSLFVTVTTEALALGLLASPGACDADIAVGEGQSFGNFLNFGGPYLGLFATRQEFIRQMPGRLVGQTVDQEGRPGFILTFNTREQHIRREKATSNICTNQSLCALATAIYLSLLGPQGLRKLAEMNVSKAQYAQNLLRKTPGAQLLFSAPVFNEFVLKLSRPVDGVLKQLQEKKIFGGLSLKRFYPELGEALLVCVTEMVARAEIDRFAEELSKIL